MEASIHVRIARSIGATLIVALLAAACGGDSDDPTPTPAAAAAPAVVTATATEQPDAGPNEAFSLEAADGNATLDIPTGALPPGVTRNDVSITAIEGPSEERFAVYRLEPDGMVPLEPLMLTVTVDLAEGEGVSVMVLDADGDPVEDAAEIVDLTRVSDDGPLDLVLQVNHFSAWIIGKLDGNLRVDTEPLSDQLVGTTFTVRARFVLDPLLSVAIPDLKGRQWTGTGDDVYSWFLTSTWRASGPISPKEVRPKYQNVEPARSALIVEQQFKCDGLGGFFVSVAPVGTIYFHLRRSALGTSILYFNTAEEPARVTWSAECVASAPPPGGTGISPPPSGGTGISPPPSGGEGISPPQEPAPEPPGGESGTGSSSSVAVEGNGVTMTVSAPNEASPGQSYRVQISIRGTDGEPGSGEILCTLARRGDPDARHDSFTLSSDGTAMLAIQVPDSWKSGDEVALFCFFEALNGDAQFITSFFLQ